jgi:hypothetical protein
MKNTCEDFQTIKKCNEIFIKMVIENVLKPLYFLEVLYWTHSSKSHATILLLFKEKV